MSLLEDYSNFFFSNQNENQTTAKNGNSLFEVMNPRRTTKKLIQVKIIPKETKALREMLKSMVILRKLKSHDNILGFDKGLMRRGRMFLEFEFVDFDLAQVLKSSKFTLSGKQKKYIFYQIVLSVAFLHANKVSHGNLCPNNVLVDKDCHVKLGGLTEAHPSFLARSERLKNVFQNYYKAPETILNNESTLDVFAKPDIWSLGCLFFELMEDKQVFHYKRQYLDLLRWVFKLLGKPKPEEVKFIKNNAAREWVLRSAEHKQKNPSSYLGGDSVSSSAKNLLDGILKINPYERPSAVEILRHPYFSEIFDESDLNFQKIVWRKKDFLGFFKRGSSTKDLKTRISQIL